VINAVTTKPKCHNAYYRLVQKQKEWLLQVLKIAIILLQITVTNADPLSKFIQNETPQYICNKLIIKDHTMP